MRHPADYIRFEMLMDVIQGFVDPDLSVIRFLERCREPNMLHMLLARRHKVGDIVITTNFDSLIEEAIIRLNMEPEWQERP
jgi:NAD-dependent SIR2 family protein deacetylase